MPDCIHPGHRTAASRDTAGAVTRSTVCTGRTVDVQPPRLRRPAGRGLLP